MMSILLLLLLQGSLGAFDTIWYHELTARLPHRPSAVVELRLHALRDFIYATIFATLGWWAWEGYLAWLLGGLLLSEVGITLWDFIEEDRTRKLAAGERITHALMGIVYGAFIAYLLPELLDWAHHSTGFRRIEHGRISWLLTAMAAGVFLSGIRDLKASIRRQS